MKVKWRLSVWVLLTVDGGESEDEEGGYLYEFYSLLMVVRVRMKKEAVWMSSTHSWWWWEWGWRRRLSVWVLLTVDGGESEDEEGGCLYEFYSLLMVVRVRMKKDAICMSSTHCWWWWEWGWRRRMSGWVLLTVDGGESEDEEGGCLGEFYSQLMVVRVRMKKEAVCMSSTHCWWWWEWGWRRRLSVWVLLTVDGGESEDEEGGCLDEFYSLLMVVRVRMKKEAVWMSSTHCWWWWEWGWRRRMSGWVLLTVDGGESEDEEGGCLDEFYSLLMVVRVRMKKEAVWISLTHCWQWWEWGWRRRMSGWVLLTVDGCESEDEEGGCLDEFYSLLMVVRVRMKKEAVWISSTHCWRWWEWGWRRRMSGWVLLTVDGGESEDEEGGSLDKFDSLLTVLRVRMKKEAVWVSSTYSWWWWE